MYLDILGFKKLVRSQSAEAAYSVVNEALRDTEYWAKLNQAFAIIYFSDTIIFYQKNNSYGSWAFLDVYGIGGMLYSAMLAKGIPVRGSITFGEFIVKPNASGLQQVFYGKALIDAYESEQRENWLGIIIHDSAIEPVLQYDPHFLNFGTIGRRFVKQEGSGCYLLNPFVKAESYYQSDLIGEADLPYLKRDGGELGNEIRALHFLISQCERYCLSGAYSSKIAAKYFATLQFLEDALGQVVFEWLKKIGEEEVLECRL